MKKTLFFVFVGGILFAQQVGINTDKPSATLHINGTVRVRNVEQDPGEIYYDTANHKPVFGSTQLAWDSETKELRPVKYNLSSFIFPQKNYSQTGEKIEVANVTPDYKRTDGHLFVVNTNLVTDKERKGGIDNDQWVAYSYVTFAGTSNVQNSYYNIPAYFIDVIRPASSDTTTKWNVDITIPVGSHTAVTVRNIKEGTNNRNAVWEVATMGIRSKYIKVMKFYNNAYPNNDKNNIGYPTNQQNYYDITANGNNEASLDMNPLKDLEY